MMMPAKDSGPLTTMTPAKDAGPLKLITSARGTGPLTLMTTFKTRKVAFFNEARLLSLLMLNHCNNNEYSLSCTLL